MNKIDWSKAPEGATHAAPAGHGVCWYRIYDGGYHYWYSDLGATWGRWEKGTGGPFHGPMEARPESKADQEKPAWKPGVDLPPVGEKAVIKNPGYSNELFDRFIGKEVEIVAHDTVSYHRVAVFKTHVADENYRYHAMVAECFDRPKSHREKVIEAAVHETGVKRKFAGRLYDLDMLKLPEGEE